MMEKQDWPPVHLKLVPPPLPLPRGPEPKLVQLQQLQRIETRQSDGTPNGYLVPIWRSDNGERVDQVYLTVVDPGTVKGPHLHQKRCGRFFCLRGAVEIITREHGRYRSVLLFGGKATILTVPPGTPTQIVCVGSEPAYLLNMPTPAWSEEDPDEWPVENWNPEK